jgi:propionyl-CoA carboxylase beta chain
VKILFKREIAAAAEPKKEEARLGAEYRAKFCTPYEAAKKAMITDVISPSETRAAVSFALRNTLSKRDTRPPKKHGTIPL